MDSEQPMVCIIWIEGSDIRYYEICKGVYNICSLKCITIHSVAKYDLSVVIANSS